jgi:MAP3K TRAFs-binding domain
VGTVDVEHRDPRNGEAVSVAEKPFCFVLMPFGKKADAAGQVIDFDRIYLQVIEPAVEQAGLAPIRADHELTGGIVHKAMFERLLLCDYAVADLTTANANVFYELGVRHALRPYSTILLFAEGGTLPFDVALARALPYALGPDGAPLDAGSASSALAQRLVAARQASVDSPVFTIIPDLPAPPIDRLKTDLFREQAEYSAGVKRRLEQARRQGADDVRAVEHDLGEIADVEWGVAVDLLLSYRAVEAWERMIDLVARMSAPLAATTLVQEQLAFGLNRAGRSEEAEHVLTALVDRRGASSETLGILGRVYKDRWLAYRDENPLVARGFLDKAIETYLRGFEADWRDAYPGVNAVTLMEVRNPPDQRREELLPVVRYANRRRIDSGKADYWDHATRLELAVLAKDEARAQDALPDGLAAAREAWEPKSTLNNLRFIGEERAKRGESVTWARAVEEALAERGRELEAGDGAAT